MTVTKADTSWSKVSSKFSMCRQYKENGNALKKDETVDQTGQKS